MKKISILSSLLVLIAGYFILSSNSAGITGQSITGCSCHGAANTATGLTLSGIPSTGWVPGTTYPITLTLTNPTLVVAGFDITVDKGTISNAPTGTAITASNLEIRHTSPQALVSGVTTWTFDWTAPVVPVSTLVIFKIAGLAANANGQNSGDQYNTTTASFIQAAVVTNPPTVSLTNVGSITTSSAVITGSVNANGANTGVSMEYGLTTAYGSTIAATPAIVTGTTATPVSTTLSALAPSTLYHFRYKASNAGGVVYTIDSTFTTLGLPTLAPTIIVNSPSTITTTTANINAQVNANNANATVSVEYGLTTAYGSTMNTFPSSVSGNTLSNVSASLSSLLPNTLYHYRVVATNSVGTTNSVDSTFTTNPVPTAVPLIILNPITNLTATTATINAQVNANNSSSSVVVEYGLTTAYGNLMNTTPNTVTGTTLTAVLTNLLFLTPNTTYHYRIRASNAAGTSYSNDATFKTLIPTTINDVATLNMSIYPNPCTDYFYIETKNNPKEINVVAYSIQGIKYPISLSKTGFNQYQIDTKNLTKGYYILSIMQDGKSAISTIIKN